MLELQSVFIRVHLPERLTVFQSGYLRFALVVVRIPRVPGHFFGLRISTWVPVRVRRKSSSMSA